MKLKRPRVESYTSPIGGGSITYVGIDHSHDMGGFDYRFIYMDGGREVAINARVSSISSAYRAAKSQGINLWSMAFEDREKFKQEYYESNPREYQVVRFFPEKANEKFDFIGAAERFCDLFLEFNASYKLNHSDYPETGEGYYWEQIFFEPHDAEPRDYFQRSVGAPQ